MGRREIKREGWMEDRQDGGRVGRKGVGERSKNHFEGVREGVD